MKITALIAGLMMSVSAFALVPGAGPGRVIADVSTGQGEFAWDNSAALGQPLQRFITIDGKFAVCVAGDKLVSKKAWGLVCAAYKESGGRETCIEYVTSTTTAKLGKYIDLLCTSNSENDCRTTVEITRDLVPVAKYYVLNTRAADFNEKGLAISPSNKAIIGGFSGGLRTIAIPACNDGGPVTPH